MASHPPPPTTTATTATSRGTPVTSRGTPVINCIADPRDLYVEGHSPREGDQPPATATPPGTPISSTFSLGLERRPLIQPKRYPPPKLSAYMALREEEKQRPPAPASPPPASGTAYHWESLTPAISKVSLSPRDSPHQELGGGGGQGAAGASPSSSSSPSSLPPITAGQLLGGVKVPRPPTQPKTGSSPHTGRRWGEAKPNAAVWSRDASPDLDSVGGPLTFVDGPLQLLVARQPPVPPTTSTLHLDLQPISSTATSQRPFSPQVIVSAADGDHSPLFPRLPPSQKNSLDLPVRLLQRPRSANSVRLPDGHAHSRSASPLQRPHSANSLFVRSRSRGGAGSPSSDRSSSGSPSGSSRSAFSKIKMEDPQWKGRPLPSFGHQLVDPELEKEKLERRKKANAAVDIRSLFKGKGAKANYEGLDKEKKREMDKAALKLQRSLRGHWRRMNAIQNRSSEWSMANWQKQYLSDKAARDQLRKNKFSEMFKHQAMENRKNALKLARIEAHVDIWMLFRGKERGISRSAMRRAAVTIQKYVRGWMVRAMLEKLRKKARVHAGSLKTFIRNYCALMRRIATRHGIEKPDILIDLWQIDVFMDQKKKYDAAFMRQAFPERQLPFSQLEAFFKLSNHFPSEKEMAEAVQWVTKVEGEPMGELQLSNAQVVEVAFQIYVPAGSGLTTDQTRQSTWLRPLVGGREGKAYLKGEEARKAQFEAALRLVASVRKEREENQRQEEQAMRQYLDQQDKEAL